MRSGRSTSTSPTRVSRRSRSRSPIRRRSRSRSPRRDRGGRGKGGRDIRGKECRVYVSNLNYDVKWMELKDVMKKLGTVEHVEIFSDGTGKSKGCGVVEYTHAEDAARAINELNGFEVLGRKVRLREDVMENDQYLEQLRQQKEKSKREMNMSKSGGSAKMGSSHMGSSSGGGGGGMGSYGGMSGMSAQLIQLLNSKGGDPMNSSVFISNLDYDISWQKLKDMFRRAGNCTRCDVAQDEDKRSKGFGTVQFETPFEALSAIALFNGMELGVKRRQMSVRLDRKSQLHQVLEQLGVPSGEVTQKTLTQIQSIATLAALSTSGALTGALSQLSALASGNPYQSLQNQSSSAGTASALAGLSGLSGIGSALSGLGNLLSGGGASGSGGMSSNISSMGGSSGGYGSYGGSYGSQSSSYGSSQMSSYSQSNQSSRRSDGGGNYGSSRSGGGGGSGGSSAAPGAKVFVRNLPFSVKWQELKDKFREAGRIVRADIKTNDDGRSKGCGTVTFESSDDANRAVSLFNQSRMDGRELEVRIDHMN